jgi:hypothetical protein
MAYRDFKLQDLQDKFGLVQSEKKLFSNIQAIQPSDWLIETIQKKRRTIRITTEKAISEAVISAILAEVQDRNSDKITLFSGENLPADRAKGLNGEVDFLVIGQPAVFEITRPVISITEAKLNQAIDRSLTQAAAQMLGAQVFNRSAKHPVEVIHGVVTNGTQWIFLKLDNQNLIVDTDEYLTANLAELLGVLQTAIDFYT